MAINLGQLSTFTTAATALGNLILVTPDSVKGYAPQNPNNLNGEISTDPNDKPILFNFEGEQTVALESDITDHYIENNTAIQDQIALKPVVITTHGFIGELNDILPPELGLLKTISEKLTAVTAYEPALSTTASLAYAEALFAYQVAASAARSAKSAWSSLPFVGGEQQQNKQQEVFTRFYGYWESRRLFTVQTPWAVFSNMAIRSLRAIQDPDTRVITDFEVSFKKINVATTRFVNLLPQTSGRLGSQSSKAVNLGTTTPTNTASFGDSLTTMMG